MTETSKRANALKARNAYARVRWAPYGLGIFAIVFGVLLNAVWHHSGMARDSESARALCTLGSILILCVAIGDLWTAFALWSAPRDDGNPTATSTDGL